MVKLKIDCQNVMSTSIFLNDCSTEFKNLTDRMKSVSKNIQTCWTGVDATNFLLTFNEHINSLSEVNEVYLQKSLAMMNAASQHGTIDSNLKKMMDDIMKESDLYAQYNNRY